MAVPISVSGDPTAPLTYVVPGSTAFIARAASAVFDGTGAAGDFLPVMTWLSQAGDVIGSYTAPSVAAGASAAVSWFPHLASSATGPTPGATFAPVAVMDNSGVGPQSTATNTQVLSDFTSGTFDTNDATTFGQVVQSPGLAITGLRILKPGEYRLDAGISGVGSAVQGWTAANAPTTFLGIVLKEASANINFDFVLNSPDGDYGFVDPLGAGGFWWSARTTYTATVSADIGTHPVFVGWEQKGGHTMNVYCTLLATQIAATGF